MPATQMELRQPPDPRAEGAEPDAAAQAVAASPQAWQARTTARNLRLLREARAARGDVLPWADAIEHALTAKAQAAD